MEYRRNPFDLDACNHLSLSSQNLVKQDYISSRSKHSTGSTMNNICKITILLKFYIMIFIGQHPLICKQSIKGLIMVTLSIINALNFDKVQYS